MDVQEILFKKILYTTDLSEGGRSAFAYAASLSRRYGAELTALHVVDEQPDLAKELVGYMDENLWEEIKARDLEEARQILINRKCDNAAIRNSVGEYCESIQSITPGKPFVMYEITVQTGNPVEQIITYADKGNYDLIVMGEIGHSTLYDAVLGSTVRRVLRRVKIPVLIIRTNP